MEKHPVGQFSGEEVQVDREIAGLGQYTRNFLTSHGFRCLIGSCECYWIVIREQPTARVAYQFVEVVCLFGREVVRRVVCRSARSLECRFHLFVCRQFTFNEVVSKRQRLQIFPQKQAKKSVSFVSSRNIDKQSDGASVVLTALYQCQVGE